MKIYFYINIIGGGGAERVIANLSTQFSQHGHEVGLITSFPIAHEYSIGKEVKRFNLETAERCGENRIKKNIRRVHRLKKILKRDKPDVLVSFMAEPNFRAILATKGLPVKAIISIRSDPNKEYAGYIGKFIGKKILPQADGCVFQTKDAKSWFPQKLQQKSCIIFNAVNYEFYQVNRTPQKGRIVTFGRLNNAKNHKQLIAAFEKIAYEYPTTSLWIYGEGNLKQKLNEQIENMNLSERVTLKGRTRDVALALAEADIFVLSSIYEGMPNALMEAMAAGVPVISTNCPCGGPKMLIDSMKNGILVPVNDCQAIVTALKKLLDNRQLLVAFGQQAKEKAIEFDPEQIYQEWENYISTVVNE